MLLIRFMASGLSSVISVAKQHFEKILFDLERVETKSLYILLNVGKAFFCVKLATVSRDVCWAAEVPKESKRHPRPCPKYCRKLTFQHL